MDHILDIAIGTIKESIKSYISSRITSYISDTKNNEFCIKELLEELERKLTCIQAATEKAAINQNKERNFILWFNQYKDAIYSAEDVMGMFDYQHLEEEVEKDKNPKHKSCNVGEKRRRTMHKDELNDLQNIISTLTRLYSEMQSFLQIAQGPSNAATNLIRLHPDEVPEGRRETSIPNESKLFGRDDFKEKILTLLKDDMSVELCYAVLAVVGMGGVGKTTLVQSIYHDEGLKNHFDVKAWVCVSNNFSIKRLMIEIMESADIQRPQDIHQQTSDRIQRHLIEGLQGKRFLIVLDDVWETMDNSRWKEICKPFSSGKKGSRILVTTRTQRFVNLVQTNKSFTLSPLDSKSFRELFLSCAFGKEQQERYPRLKDIGMQIADKLGGLPLAAQAIGATLRSYIVESHWVEILESEAWMGVEDENKVMTSLKLSYDHLPPHLKQCFIYCSFFPKNYRFRLIDFYSCWTTHGLVKGNIGNVGSSILVRNYILELVNRSFLILKNDHYVIHDLFHDLATSIAGEEIYQVEDDNTMNTIPIGIRHLFVSYGNLDTILEKVSPKRLRSLIYFNPTRKFSLDAASTNKLTSLRLLYIHSDYEAQNLRFISQLIHLRCLKVEGTLQTSGSIDYSETLCKLYQLEILLIPHGQFKDLHKLINLHVIILCDLGEDALYKKLSQNELVSSIDIEENGCKISDLRDLNKIDDDLAIQIKSHVSLEEAKEAKLIEKKYIVKLHFDLRGSNQVQEDAFQELQPHRNLKKLEILCRRRELYTATKVPSWINTVDLSNLRHIVLFGCHYLETLPHLGELPYLEIIVLERLYSLKEIGADFYGEGNVLFPSVRKIKLYGLLSLVHWHIPEGIHTLFPLLLEFNIRDCPKFKFPEVIPFPIPSSNLKQYAVRVVQVEEWESNAMKDFVEENKNSDSLSYTTRDDYNFPSILTYYIPDISLLIQNRSRTQPKIQLLKKLEWDYLNNSQPQYSSLPKLSYLEELIIRCSVIHSLPSGILPSSIKKIHIIHCHYLEDVSGIESLPVLEELIIEDCDKINIKTCLPSTINKLQIQTSSRTSKFDWRHSESEWHKICHIKKIMIDGLSISHPPNSS